MRHVFRCRVPISSLLSGRFCCLVPATGDFSAARDAVWRLLTHGTASQAAANLLLLTSHVRAVFQVPRGRLSNLSTFTSSRFNLKKRKKDRKPHFLGLFIKSN